MLSPLPLGACPHDKTEGKEKQLGNDQKTDMLEIVFYAKLINREARFPAYLKAHSPGILNSR